MNQSDFIIATAARSGRPAKRNGREVRRGPDGSVDVLLHGAPLLSVRPGGDTIEIDGDALPSRKSTRAANAVLSTCTDCRVKTQRGRWLLKTGDGRMLDYTGRIAVVNL